VADIPWVAQTVEAFVSKLFALSYSSASLTVMSANPHDHLVHRQTHRVVRGSLLAVGRPDGRLYTLAAAEGTALLSIKQAASIQNLGATCETMGITHNPWPLPRAIESVLPTDRPAFLSEYILAAFVKERSGAEQREPKDERTAASSMPALQSPGSIDELYEQCEATLTPPLEVQQLLANCHAGTNIGGDGCEGTPIGASLCSSADGKKYTTAWLLQSQRLLETLYETRYASLQRLVAFFVAFHALGRAVQNFWPRASFGLLGYDMSRSQSMMRVATTASPVSGAMVLERILTLNGRHGVPTVASD